MTDQPGERRNRPQRRPAIEPLAPTPEAAEGAVGPGEAIAEAPAPDADLASPQDAPPPPDEAVASVGAAAEHPTEPRRRDRWLAIALWTAGTLALAGATASVVDLVVDFFGRSPFLGAVALALAAALAAALLALTARELAALGRLRRVAAIRAEADKALGGDASSTIPALEGLKTLYAGRADVAWARDRAADLSADVGDGAAMLALYERELMRPLDARAEAVVAQAARQVAAVTALAPSALIDAGASLFFNLRMIRRVAEIYGGRAGVAGSIRLARRVVEHAMAAGLIAFGDDLLEPLIGGGVAGRLSRRAGEGVVNGALTARVGLAAIDVCRPLPFNALPKPSLRALAWSAVKGARKADAASGG